MPTKPVKIDIPVAKLNTETFRMSPRLRLDSSNLLYLKVYKETIERIRLNGIEVAKMEELIKPSSKKPKSQKTATIMVRSLWKLSISPINLEIRQQGFSKEVPLRSLVVVTTGQAIGKVSMVPEYLNNILPEFLGVNNVATTGDIGVFLSNKDEHVQYLDIFFNTSLGQTILELSKYGTTNQHIDLKIFMKQYVPLILVHKVIRLIESAIEGYEAKAWKAYFKAMKIVEEHFGKTEILITRIIKAKDMLNIPRFRADPSRLLAFGVVSRLVKEHSGKVCRISDLFKVHTAGVPREKKYKIREGQHPLITIDSISESGIIDNEKIYYITRRGAPYPKGSILLVKDGASIGKVGILPYDAYVMQGIATLVPKPSIDEKLKYYVLTLLKSSFYRKVIEALGYGATVQYSVTKDELESVEIPIIEGMVDEISRNMRKFVENMYQANALKSQAIVELENYLLKLLS